MINISVNSKSPALLVRRLAQYERRTVPALQRFVARVTLALMKEWRILARERPPFFEGSLANSIDRSGIVTVAPRNITFSGRVFTPLIHGAVVDFGRKPGRWPPREAIEHWVEAQTRRGMFKKLPLGPARKRGVKRTGQGRESGTGRYASSSTIGFGLIRRPMSERRAMGIRTLAFLISRKIARKGIKRKLRLARLSLKRLRREIKVELANAVRQSLGATLKSRG